MNNYEDKIRQELKQFNSNINIHDLPDIFHYWSNKHLKPMLEEYNITHPDDLFVHHMLDSISLCGIENPIFISIGAGNCDTEVRIAKRLREKGIQKFSIECLELNSKMLRRGYDLAAQEEVINNLSFIEYDINKWRASKEYTSIIANQSLHHIHNLEGLFDEIKKSLHKNGAFIVSDMIGRNGHQRWPEALDAVQNFWQELPETYKYNHQLKRLEITYENWDCSIGGFEGVRAQDILPLLISKFHFHLFIGFSNVIDIFVDRSFGHNFDPKSKWDTDFIDKVQMFDEESILNGSLKPTHMMAVMKNIPAETPHYSRGLSPSQCVRDPRIYDEKVPATFHNIHQKIRFFLYKLFRRFSYILLL